MLGRKQLILLAASLVVITNVCSAAIYLGNDVTFSRTGTYPPSGFAGGEFKVSYAGQGSSAFVGNGEFLTFCLELSEPVIASTPTPYRITSISNQAVVGGGGPNPDPISNGTAWLYKNFSDSLAGPGGLDAIDLDASASTLFYTRSGSQPDTNNWAKAVQAVIWRLEQEVSNDGLYTGTGLVSGAVISGTAVTYADALFNYITGNVTDYSLDYSGTEVVVFNPVKVSNGSVAQSMLAISSGTEEIESVPEPATLAVWGGLAAFGFVIGKLRRRS